MRQWVMALYSRSLGERLGQSQLGASAARGASTRLQLQESSWKEPLEHRLTAGVHKADALLSALGKGREERGER